MLSRILRPTFFFAVVALTSVATQASIAEDKIGPHNIIFMYEKNRNPQNTMAVYTQLDSKCHVQKIKADTPVFDFYWLMDRANYKPVNPIIKREVRKRLEVLPTKDDSSFSVVMNNLKELNTGLVSFRLTVKAKNQADGSCKAEAFLKLGPSDKNAEIRLQSIYAEAEGLFLPALRAITLTGIDTKTGKVTTRKYLAR